MKLYINKCLEIDEVLYKYDRDMFLFITQE